MSGASKSATAFQPRWWHRCVGYEIYLRSFADGDGDGVGDLRGVIDRLDHLDQLGVDLVWLTPFYPSPGHDHGYDVADYRAIDPVFGTFDDLAELLELAHGRGMRVIADLVPNHTSSAHHWFRQASSARDNAYRDYYVWRDPAPDGGPPNNWASHFGGPAWTYDDVTGQYWLHLFLPEQPDLNWANPVVADEFDDILRFWLDRGLDGFRIDVAHALVKDEQFRDNPAATAVEGLDAAPTTAFAATAHLYDVDQPGVLDIYRRWRKIADAYDALLVGEVYLLDVDAVARYVRTQDGLHLSFWFRPLHLEWDVVALRAALRSAVAATPGHFAWVQASHDRPRPVTRFGGGVVGRARALALATLLLGLPGTPFLYQGEELGLADGTLASDALQDPIAVRGGEIDAGRDGARTPMPWEPGHCYGFTSAAEPWLATGVRTDAETAAVQWDDPSAPLHRYRGLVAARREFTDLHEAGVEWLSEDGAVIAYRRGATVVVAANCGPTAQTLALPDGTWETVFSTEVVRQGLLLEGSTVLTPYEAVIYVDRVAAGQR